MSSARVRLAAVLLLLGGWAATAVTVAAPALAHAVLVSTDPADGSRLAAAPTQITLKFSENVSVEAGYLKVISSKGTQVDEGSPGHLAGDGSSLMVRLRPGLPNDSYIASWRVISADSHPVGGSITFVVGNGPLVSPTGAVVGGTTDPLVNVLFTVTRWASFAGMVLLGGLPFIMLCWPAGRKNRRARLLVRSGWLVSVVSAGLGLLLQSPYAAGTGVGDMFSTQLLSGTIGTTYGRMILARLLLLVVLAWLGTRLLRAEVTVGEQVRARDEDMAAIVGLGILATFGGTGHAVAGSQSSLALLSDTVHLTAVTLWVGGLVMLLACVLPAREPEQIAAVLPKFSTIALWSVATLVVTGTYQAWREVAPLPALWSTTYGALLLAKIGGFTLLVALGNVSRLAVRRRYLMPVAHARAASDGDPATVTQRPGSDHLGPELGESELGESELGAPELGEPELGESGQAPPNPDRLLSRLRFSVLAEAVIATVVLAVTAVLVAQAPARATYTDPFNTSLPLPAGGSGALSVTPARSGTNTITVTVSKPDGTPAAPLQVALYATLPKESIGPLEIQLTRTAVGKYRSTAASLPQPGRWQLDVQVRTSEFDRSVAQAIVRVH